MKNRMLLFILSLILFVFEFAAAQQDIKIFHENKTQGFILYANNNELFPVSISMELDLLNISFSETGKKIFVIPPKAEKFRIGELNIINPRERTKFSYKFATTTGDVTIKEYDKGYAYDLPFSKGKSFTVFQGYNGKFSHQNENSIDFTMPEGTEILAARDGIVVKIVQNNTESCIREECKKFNNYILVYHADGTFADYVHIKYNGAKIKLGDSVKKGDIVGYSGNVGWTSGPHLHFTCFLPQFEKRITLETKFRVDKGDKLSLLLENNSYLRDY